MKKKNLFLMATFFMMLLVGCAKKERAVDINMGDVFNIILTCVPYIVAVLAVIVLVVIFSIASRKFEAGKKKLIRIEALIAGGLAIVICLNLVMFGPLYSLLKLALNDPISITEASAATGKALTEDIADEGIVLLKNSNGILPLSDAVKALNVFGWASTNPVYGGTGSGAVDTTHAVTLLKGLENAGYSLNTELSDFYTAYHVGRPLSSWSGQTDWSLSEPAMDQYSTELWNNAKAFSDTAVIIIGRIGGENVDLPTDMSKVDYITEEAGWGHEGDFEAGEHYLQLSGTEEALVEKVCSDFEKVIVVLNSANPMEMGWVDNYEEIQGVLWCAGPGETGFNALGSIFNGSVNPSGRLVDTFLYDLTAVPIWNNYGNIPYANSNEFLKTEEKASLVNYVEGIYVGYKYYETAAAEGFIDYNTTVQYPFGYGLSYTKFSQEISKINDDGDTIIIEVTVTNKGEVSGKDVVELYYNPPYTNGGIEKSTANLIDFAKTSELAPGASETVSISFTHEDMASFDYLGYGCYVLEQGDYILSINSDSHNVLDHEIVTISKDVIYDDKHDGARSGDQQTAVSVLQDAQGDFTYLSRADSFANYEEAVKAPNITLDDKYFESAAFTFAPDVTVLDNEQDVMPVMNANNKLKFEDMIGLEYEDARWESMLDQMSFDEMNTIIAYGGYTISGISAIGLPSTIECDGPQSIYSNYVEGVRGTAFTSPVMLAATWNKDLAHQKGALMGVQANEMNVSGWYGPASNIHRSAFSGRNFEYYSEDAVISGKIAAQEIIGASDSGLLTYMKHYALNDQETNRKAVFTWTNEQAARENYLKAFEIAVKEGGSLACMTSYNCVGTEWTAASTALCTTILRGEWGFDGTIVTDWFNGGGYQNADMVIRGGSDRMLSLTGNAALISDQSATSVIAMREAVHHILYAEANSRVAKNLDTPLNTWEIAVIVTDVLIAIALIVFEVLIIRNFMKKEKEKDTTGQKKQKA